MSDQLQDKPSSGFGAERDVDLLLMEEFHASDAFVSWFCAKLDLPEVRGDGAWHSVSDSDGETDLLLRVNAMLATHDFNIPSAPKVLAILDSVRRYAPT